MSTVTTPAPAEITTLQGIEAFADETGQDFYELLLERLDVLRRATATDLHNTARRLNVLPSSILEAADNANTSWAESDR